MTTLVTEPLPSEQYARTAPDNDEDRGHCQIRRRAGKLLIAFALGMARRQAPASRPRTLGATSRPGNRQVRAQALKCAHRPTVSSTRPTWAKIRFPPLK
jgi:hypothetical protein